MTPEQSMQLAALLARKRIKRQIEKAERLQRRESRSPSFPA